MMKVIKKKTIRKTIRTKKKVLKISKMIRLRIIRLRMRRINVMIRMKKPCQKNGKECYNVWCMIINIWQFLNPI